MASASALSIPGSGTTTATCSPNCRNAPAASAACIRNNTGRDAPAAPTLIGIADRYGIELRHPIRHGRRAGQIGRKGISNHRWIVGGKLCAVVNKFGLIGDWDCATANVPGRTFHPLLQQYDGPMIVLAD